MDAYAVVRKHLAEQFVLDEAQVVPEATLESLQVDSIGMVELMYLLEQELGARIPDPPRGLRTVGEVVAYVEESLRAAGKPLPV